DLSRVAQELGMKPVALKADFESLKRLPMPAIVHVPGQGGVSAAGHLLVILKCDDAGVYLLDPPMPTYQLPKDMFLSVWSGNILTLPSAGREIVADLDGGGVAVVGRVLGGGAARAASSVLMIILGVILLVWCRKIRRWQLKRVLQFSILALMCAPIAFLVAKSIASLQVTVEEPRCEFESLNYDLGVLDIGTYPLSIKIRNSGRDNLVMERIDSSCVCTDIVMPSFVEPGAEAVITGSVRATGGAQRVHLTVKSNDPRGPHTVSVSWQGVTPPHVEPYRYSHPEVPLYRPHTTTVSVVYPAGSAAVVPTVFDVQCPDLNVSAVAGRRTQVKYPTQTAGPDSRTIEHMAVELTITPPARAGRVDTVCKIRLLFGRKMEEVSLPLSITFVGGSVVKPDTRTVLLTGDARRVVRLQNVPTGFSAKSLVFPDWVRGEVRGEAGAALLVLSLADTATGTKGDDIRLVSQKSPEGEPFIRVLSHAHKP
ncbi:MAG: cysteine peptidase family C39 domain-containing protein, partial [Gemmataceae bacterium]